ncbi:MAG: cytochrome c-type biogenesis protein CcmH [Gemmatimonadota bacterium]
MSASRLLHFRVPALLVGLGAPFVPLTAAPSRVPDAPADARAARWAPAAPWEAAAVRRGPIPRTTARQAEGSQGEETGRRRTTPLSPELDAVAAELAAQLRCPVCRNQSVLESSSELARQMQSVIRDQLAAGATPEEVKAYFVARYGEWILLKPTARGVNLAVYVLPPLLLLAGALLVRNRLRRWRAAAGSAEPFPTAGNETPRKGVSGAARAEAADEAVPDARPETETAERSPPGPAGLSSEDEEWLREALRRG